MIKTIQDDMLDQLATVSDAKTVDVWVGDPEAVVASPALLPALYCLYVGMEVQPNRVIGGAYGEARLRWAVILMARNVKSLADGAEICWDLIEDVRSALMGHIVTGYGRLWPDREDLISADKGLLVYALGYYVDVQLP